MIEIFLIIIIILLPLQFALNIGNDLDLVTTRILIPLLFLLWLLRSLARKRIWISNRVEAWLIISFLILSSLSLVIGRDFGLGLRKLAYLLSIFPIFFVAADISQKEKWRKKLFISITICGVIAALIAFVQFSLPYFLGLEKSVRLWENLTPIFLGKYFGKLVIANSSWLVNIGGVTWMRAFGFFPDPHGFSFFMNLCIFSSLGYFFYLKKKILKFWVVTSISLMIGAAILSFSRGAYLGLIAGAVFFVVIFLKRLKIPGKIIAMASMVLLLIVIFNFNIISQRLISSFNLKEGSNAERYKNWLQATEIIQDFPLGGVGLGNYAKTINPSAGERSSIYAHNLYLDIAAETGLLNAFVFSALILVSIQKNIRNGSMINLGLAAGLVSFSIHSIFDTALWSPQVLAIFLMIIALGFEKNKELKYQKNGK